MGVSINDGTERAEERAIASVQRQRGCLLNPLWASYLVPKLFFRHLQESVDKECQRMVWYVNKLAFQTTFAYVVYSKTNIAVQAKICKLGFTLIQMTETP